MKPVERHDAEKVAVQEFWTRIFQGGIDDTGGIIWSKTVFVLIQGQAVCQPVCKGIKSAADLQSEIKIRDRCIPFQPDEEQFSEGVQEQSQGCCDTGGKHCCPFRRAKPENDFYKPKKRYEEYQNLIKTGEKPTETPKEILDDLGVDRFCCRRMIISHVDLIQESAPYE